MIHSKKKPVKKVNSKQKIIEESKSESPVESISKRQKLDVRGVTFKEAKEWVAGAPDQSNEESEFVKKIRLKEPETVISEQIYDRRDSHTLVKTEPDIQDFHLSIGTISLTVENPQSEPQALNNPSARGESKAAPESGSSRLCRHYLRVR